jgi:hypothetical protein
MAVMFAAVGNRVQDEVDSRIGTVQRDLDRSVRSVGEDLADRFDERLRESELRAP